MRLIDADSLAKFIDYGHLNNPNEKLYSENDIREMIDMMPTIDAVPVRHGHWEEVPYKTVEHGEVVIIGKTVRCSTCKHAGKGWNKGMNYCPNCGSRNVKKDD